MDKMREGFEAWVSLKNLETSYGNYADDEYDATWTQVYWEGWQASRKALVVELPCPAFFNDDSNAPALCCRYAEIKKELDAAGVSYK